MTSDAAPTTEPTKDEEWQHLIFGYGSIINDESRKSTGSGPTARVVVTAGAKLARAWCFCSSTGFTALGVVESDRHAEFASNQGAGGEPAEPAPCDLDGVLLAVRDAEMLAAFDAREAGYNRVQLDPSHIRFVEAVHERKLQEEEVVAGLLAAGVPAWVYIPVNLTAATAEFPICQTYVDVVLQGCLEWGGEALAEAFITSTRAWSKFFLNDTPLSRRPWIHRKRYKEIDALLRKHGEATFFAERKHPEEFMGLNMGARGDGGRKPAEEDSALQGLWGVPARNPNFIGREHSLARMQTLARAERPAGGGAAAVDAGGGISRMDVVGFGGIGKTHLTAEFCHRHFGRTYGLVVWLRAASPEALSSDLRRLAREAFGMEGSSDQSNAQELKARLFAAKVRWLVVFDNVEDAAVVAEHLPRGAQQGGALVIVTSRRQAPAGPGPPVPTLALACFDMEESVELLRSSAGHLAPEGSPGGGAT